MVVAKFLVAVAGLVMSVSGFAHNTDSTNSIDCDFTGMDLDSAISRMLAKIPAYEEKVGDTYRHTLAGIAFIGINMTGMNKLIQYGPAIRYCVNGTRMVQVDLVNDGDVKISVPWKSCEGSTGTIYLTADFSRFTTQLRVKENGFGEVSFSNEGPVYPVSTEEIKLRITGAGMHVMMAANYLSLIFPGFLREMWNDQFFYYAYMSIVDAIVSQ
uniref:Metastriate one of each protein family n=1 Tax=Rhipicephalus appendiculatus TaxID=34631 RepID=A0A131Z224_RHIAP